MADLGTRAGVKLDQLGPESVWQSGPSFLSLRRDLWPVTRPNVKADFPSEEARDCPEILLSSASRVEREIPHTVVMSSVEEVMNYSNSLKTVKRILARLIMT